MFLADDLPHIVTTFPIVSLVAHALTVIFKDLFFFMKFNCQVRAFCLFYLWSLTVYYTNYCFAFTVTFRLDTGYQTSFHIVNNFLFP